MADKKRANKAELARILGVSHTVLSKYQHLPTFPAFDRSGLAEIYAVCVWHNNGKNPAPQATPDDDLAGDVSEGLERYRMAKAQQEEIKLAETRHQIVKLNDFEESMQIALQPWRRLGEAIKRQGLMDVFAMIEEANQEVAESLERLYGHAPTAEHAGLA
jgi:phage terminase Nu1 subunit (DNA packaging protein)